jgi:hypothetical protein
MDGTRCALIVASYEYQDPGLRRLRAPAQDAEALARVLSDPKIGDFDVRTVVNEPEYLISEAVEEFFADRTPDDLLVLHFSCHGVKDEGGELYFATTTTKLRLLGATAVAADFVNRCMNRSRSRRVVLLLDCCYAGAFERGMVARAGRGVGIEERFGGRGRAVITASSAMEYAFEGDELADVAEPKPSVFTSALVEGLETGEADRDQDGHVALDELYDYVYDKVREATPNQTPGKWTFGVQGDLYIARRSHPVTKPAPLPPELQQAIDNPLAGVRAGAVPELGHLLESRHAGLALAAKLALERLTKDDSISVRAAAVAALRASAQPAPVGEPAPPKLQLSDSVIDFGRLREGALSPQRTVRLGNAGGGILNAQATTPASWLRLLQVYDQLVVTVDTTVVGDYDGAVSIESEGGSATIRVLARIDPEHPAASSAAATGHFRAAPEAPKRAHASTQGEAVLTEGTAAARSGESSSGATTPTPTALTEAVDRAVQKQADPERPRQPPSSRGPGTPVREASPSAEVPEQSTRRGSGMRFSWASVSLSRRLLASVLAAVTLVALALAMAIARPSFLPWVGAVRPTPVPRPTITSAAPPPAAWSPAAPMSVARESHTLTVLPDGRVLAVGGYNPNPILNSAEIYDASKNSWSAAAPMSGPHAGQTATLLGDGRVLVVGGFGADLHSSTATEVYDPRSNSWGAAGSLHDPRVNHRAVLLPTGRALVVGGMNRSGPLASAELWNPATNTWSPAPNMSMPRSAPTATLLKDGRVLVAGGDSAPAGATTGAPQASAEIYDYRSNSWSKTASMSVGREEHTATLLGDGRVLVAGGVFSQPSAELYAPATGSWSPAGSPSVSRREHVAVLLPSGSVLVAGGAQGNDVVGTCERYDPATNTWSPAPSMSTPRWLHAAASLRGGLVLVSGGGAGISSNAVASAEIYR